MVVVLRTLLNLGNDYVLRPFDVKLVRRSRTLGDEQARGLSQKRIVFFHAPKCGGTSVHKLLATAFGGPAGLDPIAAEAAARNLGMSGLEVREAVLAYFVKRSHARFISGHYAYSRRAFTGHEHEFDLITILRNPIDRFLSHYYYNRFKDERNHFPIECDLQDWLQTDQARAAATVFAKLFVGEPEISKSLDATGRAKDMRAAVSDAIANLSRFAIVGVLEHLDTFERDVRQRYGIKNSIGHLRKSPKAGYPKFADQPTQVQDRILEMCAPDMAIYETFAPRPKIRRAFAAVPRMAE
jgi:sulfotransferase famil protein